MTYQKPGYQYHSQVEKKEVVESPEKGRVIITPEFYYRVSRLCQRISGPEWSGFLFFQIEGGIDKPEGIVITPVDIWLNDIGTSAHTQFENDSEEILDIYDKHPEFMECRMGLIHSHNTMPVFFSGEDMDELRDNCVNVDFYFSLIVNNFGLYCAKIAISEEEQMEETRVTTYFPKTRQQQSPVDSRKKVVTVMKTIDFNISIPVIDELEERINFIEEKCKPKVYTPPSYNGSESRLPVRVFPKPDLEEYTSKYKDRGTEFSKKGKKSKYPNHVSERQLNFQGKTVAEEMATSLEFDDLMASILVTAPHYAGSIRQALAKIEAEVDDAFADTWVDQVMETYDETYTELTGEILSETMEIAIFSHMAGLPDKCLAITKLKNRVRKELIEEYGIV